LTKILIICLLLLQIPTATFAVAMKDALNQAVGNLFRDEKFLNSDYSVFVRVADKASSKQNYVTKDVETGLFLALLSSYPKRNFMMVSMEESDISIKGISQIKGDTVQLQLNVSRKTKNGERFSNTSVVFVHRQKKESSDVIVLNIEADFLSPSNRQSYSKALRTAVKKQNNFTVFSSPDLSLFSQEEVLKKTGCQGDACAVFIGKQFNVDLVLVTRITKTSSSRYHIFCRLINVDDGNLQIVTRTKHVGNLAYLPFSLEKAAIQLGEQKKLAAILAELKQKDSGQIVVTSEVPYARIYLDGKKLGQRTNAVIENVPFGTHTLLIVKDNVENSKTFDLQPGETLKFHFKLRPLEVTTIKPDPGISQIPLDSQFRITFNSRVNPQTVTSETLFLERNGIIIPGKIEISKKEVIFTPQKKLRHGQRYDFIATTEIRNLDGSRLLLDGFYRYRTKPYPAKKDADILIFSQSHGPITYTQRKSGTLQIGITSFSPILHADVNGKEFDASGKTELHYNLPYRRKSRPLKYVVRALTEFGMASRTFVIHFGKKPKPKKPPFSLISILKASQTDNLTSATSSSSKTSASKMSLTLVPQYRVSLGKNFDLSMKAIILRDKYTDNAYQNRETAFTKISSTWIKTQSYLDKMTAELSWSKVGLDNGSPLLGETDFKTESAFSLGVEEKFGKDFTLSFGVDYLNQDFITEPADPDDNADATVINLKTGLKLKLFDTTVKLKTKYGINDAVGKYKDSTTTVYDLKQTIPLGDWTPSWGYTIRETVKETEDARTVLGGIKVRKKSGTLLLKISYKLLPKFRIALDYKNKQQESNYQNYNDVIVNSYSLSFSYAL
jgi:hypothetical protein